ncbi:MAG: bifunctional [glutamine synthetase] adenylyltransferase/[glutamine synthetase]-adenylyl-L-tyrosine phosphorylase, partial [Rhizobiaceae bacterium]
MNSRSAGSTDGTGWFGKPVRQLHPLDEEAAREQALDLAREAKEKGAVRLAALLRSNSPLTRFLTASFDLSFFLRDYGRRQPAVLEKLFDQPIEARLAAIAEDIRALPFAGGMSEQFLMAALRDLKTEAHFLIALADLATENAAPRSTERLSALAEACIGAAVSFLLLEADRQGKLALPDKADPGKDSGWIVLAMGKLGAGELNFSSDVDLIVFFDLRSPAIVDPPDASDLFVRLTRRLVRILQDRTGNGYVFRTDLRLRPDPGSTPLAIPVEAAFHYYEGRGQNWERAAMIKARPIAGDIAAGKAFLKELQPYVWRKYLDYAAIADVHSIKRQIHAHRGHGTIAVAGHNVKLGRGGIREIEFFVQTQQLIAGGRFPELRGRATVPMLAELASRGWITGEARDVLTAQYWFLRDVEHAIQMVADEQSHTLPEDD